MASLADAWHRHVVAHGLSNFHKSQSQDLSLRRANVVPHAGFWKQLRLLFKRSWQQVRGNATGPGRGGVEGGQESRGFDAASARGSRCAAVQAQGLAREGGD